MGIVKKPTVSKNAPIKRTKVEFNRFDKAPETVVNKPAKMIEKIDEAIKKLQNTESSCCPGIRDEDLVPIAKMLEEKETKNTLVKLTPEMIKTLPVGLLTTLIEDRRGELKQLKLELIERMI